MSETTGKLVTCDRCGKNLFLKCVGEGETDGGYTRWNKFETAPDGWEWHSDTGMLCQDCNHMYATMIENFMNCGWSWEGTAEEVVRVPFVEEPTTVQTPCDSCSNNPKNGGSGICHCILGQKNFNW